MPDQIKDGIGFFEAFPMILREFIHLNCAEFGQTRPNSATTNPNPRTLAGTTN